MDYEADDARPRGRPKKTWECGYKKKRFLDPTLCTRNMLQAIGTTTTTVLRPFFLDHPGNPVPEENFWTLWCKGRLTEADTSTIQMGTTPFRLVTSAHLHHPPYFLQAGCPSCRPTNSVKAPKAIGN